MQGSQGHLFHCAFPTDLIQDSFVTNDAVKPVIACQCVGSLSQT